MSEQIGFSEILKNAKRNCDFNLRNVQNGIIKNAINFERRKLKLKSSNAF